MSRYSLNTQLTVTGASTGTGSAASAARREFPNQLVFPRNVPSRSTFHSGEDCTLDFFSANEIL